jgi:hypothetical protein
MISPKDLRSQSRCRVAQLDDIGNVRGGGKIELAAIIRDLDGDPSSLNEQLPALHFEAALASALIWPSPVRYLDQILTGGDPFSFE